MFQNRTLRLILLALPVGLGLLLALTYQLAWRPAPREAAPVDCTAAAPLLQPGQVLKVMTWNIQYLAGEHHLSWYDRRDAAGPDRRPSRVELARTLDEAVRVLREEQPDLVLLQELHDGARASDYQDQLAQLQVRLGDLYPCTSQAFYWKAAFVPHPALFGSVGMKLGTLSRYRIEHAERLQLPRLPANPLQRVLAPQRALLVSYLPLRGGGQLAALNTHLEALAQDGATLRRQLAMTSGLLERLQAQGLSWLLGGDFNLLPPAQYARLPPAQRRWYVAGELERLAARYPMIPGLEQAGGPQQAAWHTQVPHQARAAGADRTLDYLFHSPRLTRLDARVRQQDTRGISDHLPLVARLLLPLDQADKKTQ